LTVFTLLKSVQTGLLRDDFIAIGDKDAKQKFSGHFLGTGCEGEFTMNTLLYDFGSKTIIDPTGYGVDDSEYMILRITLPPERWDEWLNNDRLLGMMILRFINFASRGYNAESFEMTVFLISKLKEYFVQPETKDKILVTLKSFFSRKIFVSKKELAQRKEYKFRTTTIKLFDKVNALHPEVGSGAEFYNTYLRPHYPANWEE